MIFSVVMANLGLNFFQVINLQLLKSNCKLKIESFAIATATITYSFKFVLTRFTLSDLHSKYETLFLNFECRWSVVWLVLEPTANHRAPLHGGARNRAFIRPYAFRCIQLGHVAHSKGGHTSHGPG